MLEVKIREDSVEPGKPFTVATYIDGRLDNTEPFDNYDEARIYAKGIRDGFRLLMNSVNATVLSTDCGRQGKLSEEV